MVQSLPPDQERVKTLLSDTIKLLCKNGLTYKTEFCLNGVIGITLDKSDVFLVDIRETIKLESSDVEDNEEDTSNQEVEISSSRKRRKRKDRSPRRNEDMSPISSEMEIIEIPDNQFQEEIAQIKTEDNSSSRDSSMMGLNVFPMMSSVQNPTSNTDTQQTFLSNAMNYPPTYSLHSSNPQRQHQPQHHQQQQQQQQQLMQQQMQQMKSHQRPPQTQANGKNLFTCTICQQTMSTSNGLRYHMNRHKGIYPYYCPYCNKGQPGTTDLKNHLASVHTQGQAGYLCIYCGFTATAPNALKVHLDTCRRNASNAVESSPSITDSSALPTTPSSSMPSSNLASQKSSDWQHENSVLDSEQDDTGQQGTADLNSQLASIHSEGQSEHTCMYCGYQATSPSIIAVHIETCARKTSDPESRHSMADTSAITNSSTSNNWTSQDSTAADWQADNSTVDSEQDEEDEEDEDL